MTKNILLKACLLSLAFTSCSQKNDWTISRIHSGSPQFSSSKLSCYATDLTNGMDVELLSTQESCHMYLNVHSHPVKPYKGDSKKALVQVIIGDEKHSGLAFRHEGGQRLLVPENIRDLIIEALLNELPLTIKIPGYSTQLDPEEFAKKYEKFQHPPLFTNPFHSPL